MLFGLLCARVVNGLSHAAGGREGCLSAGDGGRGKGDRTLPRRRPASTHDHVGCLCMGWMGAMKGRVRSARLSMMS